MTIILLRAFTFIITKTITLFLRKNIIYKEAIAVAMAAGIALINMKTFLSLYRKIISPKTA